MYEIVTSSDVRKRRVADMSVQKSKVFLNQAFNTLLWMVDFQPNALVTDKCLMFNDKCYVW